MLGISIHRSINCLGMAPPTFYSQHLALEVSRLRVRIPPTPIETLFVSYIYSIYSIYLLIYISNSSSTQVQAFTSPGLYMSILSLTQVRMHAPLLSFDI